MRVRDTGVGIAPELQSRIFEPFVQGDRSLDRSQSGLGIGLTLVKRLVEMHGGSVAVASQGAGQGSEFTVRLPALPEPPGHRDPGVSGVRAHVGDAPGKRVLIADDNVDACESIAMILRVYGYDVRCVYDGPSVLQTAASYRPGGYRHRAPGLSGYEVARQLRNCPSSRNTAGRRDRAWSDDHRRRSRRQG